MYFISYSFSSRSSRLYFLFFISFFISLSAISQPNHIRWTSIEATPGMQGNLHVNTATDSVGNTFVINQTQDASTFAICYRFFCYDKNGTKKWQYDNDTSATNYSIYTLVIPTNDGGAIFLGANMKRIDANGQLVWKASFALPDTCSPLAVKLDKQQALIVALNYYTSPNLIEDFAIAKYEIANGTNIWYNVLPDASTVTGELLTDAIIDIELDTNDAIYALGFSGNTFIATFHQRLFKIHTNGMLLWNSLISNNTLQEVYADFCVDERKYIHVCGTQNGQKAQIVTLKPDGSLFNVHFFQKDSSFTEGYAILSDSVNNVFALASFRYWIPDSSFAGGQFTKYNYIVCKLDSVFAQQWLNTFLVTPLSMQHGYGYPVGFVQQKANTYIASVGMLNAQHINDQFIVNKIDKNGNQLWYQSSPNFSVSSKGVLLCKDGLSNVYASYAAQDIFPANVQNITHQYSDSLVNTLVTNVVFYQPTSPTFQYWISHNKQLNITTENTLHAEINIFTMGGTQLFSSTYEGTKQSIDISAWTPGIYILQVANEKWRKSEKFIVNH